MQGADSPAAAAQRPHLALVRGQPVTQLPDDLYIPPDALEVFLETFEGPLDLLLYLIKKQNLDILDIPIVQITRQYMEYVELMREFRLELAAEYLVMAAVLAEIKSRMLLPRRETDEEEADPRAELVRRLQEYERFKQAAEDLDALPRLDRDTFLVSVASGVERLQPQPAVDLPELLLALKGVFKRASLYHHHKIEQEPLSLRERMSQVLERISHASFANFSALFDPAEGRAGVVVTFLAVLELLKLSLIELVQAQHCGEIHVRAAA